MVYSGSGEPVRHLKKIVGLLLSVLFLWLALRKVDLTQIPMLLPRARLSFLPLLLITYTCEQLWRAARWKMLLRERVIPFFNLYAGIVLCYLFNNLLPARAGEFARALYLGRKGLARTSEAFGSVVLERFLDGVFLVSLLGYVVWRFQMPAILEAAISSAVIFYAVIFLIILLLQFRRSWVDRPLQWVIKPLPQPWQERILSIQGSFISGFDLIRYPLPFFYALVLTYISWGFSILTLWLTCQMWVLGIDLDGVILLMAVLSVGSMIPSSPGMIGIYQYCCVLALSDLLKVNRELAATFALAAHLQSYLYILLVGMGVMAYEKMSYQELSRSAEENEAESPA